MKTRLTRMSSQSGFSILEVLVGITIFALGILALAHLQGSLARSSGDANARTIAVNLAEETLESMRAFSQVTSDGTNAAFNDIVSASESRQIGGVDFTATTVVTDYYYQPATDNFTTNKPAGIVNADMKRVELEVSWGDGVFNAGDGTTRELGSGRIAITDIISSITSPSGGKVVLNASSGQLFGPPIDYNPGQNPDIIPIQLGENKFKESTTPLPDVIRREELVETKFDVVTYSQSDTGAVFLRREEFLAVSCECTLKAPSESPLGGRRPTVWAGTEYTEGEFVTKPYGVSANNQQSIMCDVCCRDHHDGGTGENDVASDPGRSLTNPFRDPAQYFESGTFAGDHKHYNRDGSGNLSLVTSNGGTYVEACRMIRKDGFFRVAQDFHQEGLNSFPADYLDESGEISEYSKYVTDAVKQYEDDIGATNGYENSPPSLAQPGDMTPAVEFPASTALNPTSLPTSSGADQQQLRARGIYIDYLSDEIRAIVNCFDLGGNGESCGAPQANSALEVLPFFDVQLTWLSRWNETPINNPVDVSNETIADDNTHSRGMAEVGGGMGDSTVETAVHLGNLGFTGTDAIDQSYLYDLRYYNLYMLANSAEPPPPTGTTVISGQITSSVGGVKAADVEISSIGAQCDRTNDGFECVLETGASEPSITVTNYDKRNKILVACSDVLVVAANTMGTGAWTRFLLPSEPTSNANIVIMEDYCS